MLAADLDPCLDADLEADYVESCQRPLDIARMDVLCTVCDPGRGCVPAGMPVAAWMLGECLLHWAWKWRPSEVDGAAVRIRDGILASAESEGLTLQAYWLSTTLALGAFLKASLAFLCI